MNNTKEFAINKWRGILAHFIDDKLLDGQHHPCPICGGKDRFRFDNKNGNGSFYCNSCGAGSGIHLLSLSLGLSYTDAWKEVEKVIGESAEQKPQDAVNRTARVKKILAICHPIIQGGEVWRYLQSRRITEIPSNLHEAEASSGAMMMVGRFAKGNKLAGLHVTFIRNGQKDESCGSAKKMFGLVAGGLNGSAIRLHPLNGSIKIVVGEGIETTLSSAKMFGLPGLATGTAGLLEKLEIPAQIKEVVIAGDNDASFTGQASAYILAKRLTKEGKKCKVCIPTKSGTDFNDAQEN